LNSSNTRLPSRIAAGASSLITRSRPTSR
jgi:hypothetical protein